MTRAVRTLFLVLILLSSSWAYADVQSDMSFIVGDEGEFRLIGGESYYCRSERPDRLQVKTCYHAQTGQSLELEEVSLVMRTSIEPSKLTVKPDQQPR